MEVLSTLFTYGEVNGSETTVIEKIVYYRLEEGGTTRYVGPHGEATGW